MKNILLWCMIAVNIQAIHNDSIYTRYKLEEKEGFSPIHKEQPLRFPNQDITEIIWEEELGDCTGFPEGEESPSPETTDMQELVSYEETK